MSVALFAAGATEKSEGYKLVEADGPVFGWQTADSPSLLLLRSTWQTSEEAIK